MVDEDSNPRGPDREFGSVKLTIATDSPLKRTGPVWFALRPAQMDAYLAVAPTVPPKEETNRGRRLLYDSVL